jgi:hypothetical protein
MASTIPTASWSVGALVVRCMYVLPPLLLGGHRLTLWRHPGQDAALALITRVLYLPGSYKKHWKKLDAALHATGGEECWCRNPGATVA